MLFVFFLLQLLRTSAAPTTTTFGPALPPYAILFGRTTGSDCQRTLLDIVQSCLVTIAACVFQAIHPNIPDPKAGFCKKQFQRVKITLHATICPEVIIFWAIRQRLGSRIVRDEVNKAFEDLRLNSPKYPVITWTATHGHFAQMGGFCRDDTGVVLFPPTLVDFIREDRINLKGLQITKEQLEDRSKGNLISKVFVTLQTTWFVLECLSRWLARLPLTELEVITLAYATLNIITCAVWWNKPLNVGCPNYLEILPKKSGNEKKGYYQVSLEKSDDAASVNIPLLEKGGQTDLEQIRSFGDVLHGLSWGTEEPLIEPVFTRFRSLIHNGRTHGVQRIPFTGWCSGLTRLISRIICYNVAPFVNLIDQSTVTLNATHVPPYYAMKIPTQKWWIMWYPSCAIFFLFGVVHFIAWNSDFVYGYEQFIWQISTIVMVVAPLIFVTLGLLFDFNDRGPRLPYSLRVILHIFCFIMALVTLVVAPAYAGARAWSFFEAGYALRQLPPGARILRGVTWSSFVPHI
ncbi:hypothetical protein BDN72DRAFT_855036 [Pluteus cervinus]|uniref:Uncharacterized protein n=1 Tax=Pluteus cervinus TaxID=181527 RepID=A0ACD3B530_9AGAR|nr:hypothetical protein BDN72DRAFT_855036 [Pluteus cervinus]